MEYELAIEKMLYFKRIETEFCKLLVSVQSVIQIVPINLALLIYTIYKSGCLRAPTTNILMYTYRPLVIDLAYFRDRKLKEDVYWSIHCNEKNGSQSSKFRYLSKTRPQKYSRQFYEHRLP